MTDQAKVPETINLIIIQADKDGQLTALNHPIVRQFSSEYMMIVSQALKDVAKGIKKEAQAKALEEAKKARDALS
jgi:hypothetical protein